MYQSRKQLEKYTQTAADAVKQLVESKNLAKRFSEEMKELDEEKYKDQIKASKDIIKAIDSVVAKFIGKEDKRQGITRNPEITVMQRIGTATRYVATRKSGVTKTENDLIKFAKDDLKKALDATNIFFEEKWKPYRTKVQQLDLSPFKKTETFTLE